MSGEPIMRVDRDAAGNTCWVVESASGGERREFACGHLAMDYLRHLRQTLGFEPTRD